MFHRYRRWKKERAIQNVKPGDGHPLKSFHWWHMIYRSLFFIRLMNEDGSSNVYAVDINFFDENEKADLYVDDKHYAYSKLPATFPVPGGLIEVETTTYGMKRIHYVTKDGIEQQLYPHPQSLEGLRLKFDFHFPGISKWIGIIAIIILITSLILGLPQLVALISQIPFISERWGTFESPVVLPSWLNTILVVGGTLATIERAATMRSHWLVDMDTWWDD